MFASLVAASSTLSFFRAGICRVTSYAVSVFYHGPQSPSTSKRARVAMNWAVQVWAVEEGNREAIGRGGDGPGPPMRSPTRRRGARWAEGRGGSHGGGETGVPPAREFELGGRLLPRPQPPPTSEPPITT